MAALANDGAVWFADDGSIAIGCLMTLSSQLIHALDGLPLRRLWRDAGPDCGGRDRVGFLRSWCRNAGALQRRPRHVGHDCRGAGSACRGRLRELRRRQSRGVCGSWLRRLRLRWRRRGVWRPLRGRQILLMRWSGGRRRWRLSLHRRYRTRLCLRGRRRVRLRLCGRRMRLCRRLLHGRRHRAARGLLLRCRWCDTRHALDLRWRGRMRRGRGRCVLNGRSLRRWVLRGGRRWRRVLRGRWRSWWLRLCRGRLRRSLLRFFLLLFLRLLLREEYYRAACIRRRVGYVGDRQRCDIQHRSGQQQSIKYYHSFPIPRPLRRIATISMLWHMNGELRLLLFAVQVSGDVALKDAEERCSGDAHSRPPASTARVCSSGPNSSAPWIDSSSASRVRARLTRDLMVPTAQPQI